RLLCRERSSDERLRTGIAATELPAAVDRRRAQGAPTVERAGGGRAQYRRAAAHWRRPFAGEGSPSGARRSIATGRTFSRRAPRPPGHEDSVDRLGAQFCSNLSELRCREIAQIGETLCLPILCADADTAPDVAQPRQG